MASPHLPRPLVRARALRPQVPRGRQERRVVSLILLVANPSKHGKTSILTKSLTEQATGMAYAWKKMEPLKSIEVWHFQNWINNRNEGGPHIGLRRFPEAPGAPLAPKPIWHLNQALGAEHENRAGASYLKTVGVTDWSQILHSWPITR